MKTSDCCENPHIVTYRDLRTTISIVFVNRRDNTLKMSFIYNSGKVLFNGRLQIYIYWTFCTDWEEENI